ncbi:hypothetical protein [Erythrobacter sp.]|uniref:hypothetical protein n=1 Tax=Erythrobacter sp. TaxID=1042 RepID=UPI002EB0234E|nr:hypothetical protein [Erythrobacter sp.]
MTFGDHLRREADYVLDDVIFQRSPTQAMLLRFLVERALSGGPSPTQHEIAVEALGKPDDFDLANDSYPRVQVSRLRASLDNYYSRTQPHDGHRLTIEQGQYEITLTPYQRPAPPTPPNVPDAAGDDEQAGDSVMHEDRAGRPEAAGAAPAPLTDGAFAGTMAASARAEPSAPAARRRGRAFVITPIAIIGLLVAGLLAWRMASPEETLPAADLEKPTIVLQADLTGLEGNGSADRDTAQFAVRLAEILLAYSLVTGTRPASEEERADYTLTMSFVHEPDGALQAFLSFADADGDVLFNELVEHDRTRRERFADEIRSALTHITSPTGEVAQDRRRIFGNSLESGYTCFITIENVRADGGAVADMVDSCIDRFPKSEFTPYFRARRAFAAYQGDRLEGKPIRASGPAWRDLQLALDADPFNSFANVVAAKVLLASGQCDAARAGMEIAFEQATNYPALRAAIDAEAPSCPSYAGEVGLSDEQLRAMIAANPAPDALQHLYMLVAALAENDMTSAKMLAARPFKPASAGRESETVAKLHRALDDPAFARANADQLRTDIALNIWGERTVDLVIENLTRDPAALPDQAADGGAMSTGTAPTSPTRSPYR